MKAKPIVQIYERATSNGKSLYLHYTINGKQYRESTGLKLTGNKKQDAETRKAILLLQTDRINEILTGKTGLRTETQKDKILLCDFCTIIADKYKEDGKPKTSYLYKLLSKHISAFNSRLRLTDTDKKQVTAFIDYLQKADMKQTSKKVIYSKFVSVLNKAVKNEYILANPAKNVERIEAKQTERVYLTESEIKAFFKTEPNKNQADTKQAFLFSLLTGLRMSDIYRLTSENIEENNGAYRLKIDTKKTDKFISFELSTDAQNIIKDRLTKGGFIFKKKTNTNLNKDLADIAKRANIDKKVTFHTARHTFATLLLTKGADIYTISTMLGHSNITTTQVYAKIIDSKKDNASKLLSGVL